MTTAQDLDRSISIQRYEGVPNEFNEIVDPDWRTVFRVRAKRVDVSDGEKFAAGGIGGFLTARFIIRSTMLTRTISPYDQIEHEGRIWNLSGVKERDEGRHRFLELTASVGTNQAGTDE